MNANQIGLLDLPQFYRACNPSRPLAVGWHPPSPPSGSGKDDAPTAAYDRQYYVDFSPARGDTTVASLSRTIARVSPEDPTCQLLTGPIGSGKSTELLKLKFDLEQQGFCVLYLECSQIMDLAEVTFVDVLLGILLHAGDRLGGVLWSAPAQACDRLYRDLQESFSLSNSGAVAGTVEYLAAPLRLARAIAAILQTPLQDPLSQAPDRHLAKQRQRLRQLLEPRTNLLLSAINAELLQPATAALKRQGKRGLVILVDHLDRARGNDAQWQPERLFVDWGNQLRQLHCHVVYTMPIALMFSKDYQSIKNNLGGGVAPKLLPMVAVRDRQGKDNPQGIALLRQLVLARAFPTLIDSHRQVLLSALFDSESTLDRLCRVSGGHIRTLLSLLWDCLQRSDPPFSRSCVEQAIAERCQYIGSMVSITHRGLLSQIAQTHAIDGNPAYQSLLHNLLVLEYQDGDGGRWFDLHPLLVESSCPHPLH